jgi:hypothetical protein
MKGCFEIMNETQLQSVAERLASKRGLSAKSIGTIIDVDVNYSAVLQYVEQVYEYLDSVYNEPTGLSEVLSQDEFRIVCMAVLAKRIQWVRQRVYGMREGRTIQVSNTTPLPGPIFMMVYLFGRVESDLGAIFVPSYNGLEEHGQSLTIDVMRKYLSFVTKLKHYYAFSEGMPSQDHGTWAYLLHVDQTAVGSVISGPSSEGTPNDAYMAAVIRCATMLASFFYGSSYGVIQSPEIATIELFDSYGKGIGDGK